MKPRTDRRQITAQRASPAAAQNRAKPKNVRQILTSNGSFRAGTCSRKYATEAPAAEG